MMKSVMLWRSSGLLRRSSPLVRMYNKPAGSIATTEKAAVSPAGSSADDLAKNNMRKQFNEHTPSDFYKRILVWNKAYPTVADVPDTVPEPQMRKAIEYFRIRVSLIMIVVGLIGCFVAARVGIAERNAGKSLIKENLEWHEAYNAQHKAKNSD